MEFEFIKSGHKISDEKTNLFSKVKLENKKEVKKIKEVENKNSFEKLNLKVGQIVEVKKVETSEKLFVFKVDLKEETPRQILSGIQEFYNQEELINRKVVVFANLKPAKLAGLESNGMILAVDDKSKCKLLTTNLEIGENLKVENLVANNENKVKIKVFQKLNLYSKNGNIFLDNKEIEGIGVEDNLEGEVC
jgi:methionyl-tRNA synthetase